MERVKVGAVKLLAETHKADVVIVVTFDSKGKQCVATYGREQKQSKWAAKFGNEIKKILEWPKYECNAQPLERICGSCDYYKPDYGIFCANGWSDDGSYGDCNLENISRKTTRDRRACLLFEGKNWG